MRHCLTPWVFLFLALLLAFREHVGWVAPPILALLGLIATGRIALYGYWKHSLLLVLLLFFSIYVRPVLHGLDQETRKRTGKGLWDYAEEAKALVDDSGRVPEVPEKANQAPPEPQPEPELKPPPVVAPVVPEVPVHRIEAEETVQSTEYKEEVLARLGALFGARERADWQAVRSFYADQFQLNGQKVPDSEALSALAADGDDWATMRESLQGEMSITGDPGELVTARFKTAFDFRDEEDTPLIGFRAHVIKLIASNGEWRITQHDVTGEILPTFADKWARAVGEEIHRLLMATFAAEAAGQIDTLSGHYADKVWYFGKSRSRDEILSDKRDYAERWPQRSERFLSSPAIYTGGEDSYGAEFTTAFRVQNPETNEWRSGTVKHQFAFSNMNGLIRISLHNGEVTITGKGNLR